MFAGLEQDARFACRGLLRARSFSAAAVLTLALGIAGTTVMFTLINGVLLRPLPIRDQDRVVVSWKELRASGFAHHPFGDAEIERVRETSQLLEIVGGVDAKSAYVRQRDREIAIRSALGATRARVGRLVLGESLSLAGLGAVVGVAAATGTTRVLRGMLFEIDALDPLTLCGAALILVAAAVLATGVPMRRATRVDSVAILRN